MMCERFSRFLFCELVLRKLLSNDFKKTFVNRLPCGAIGCILCNEATLKVLLLVAGFTCFREREKYFCKHLKNIMKSLPYGFPVAKGTFAIGSTPAEVHLFCGWLRKVFW